MVVNLELNEEEEPGCIAVLADKKYFHVGQSFLKRTLREGEWPTSRSGRAIVPSPSYEHRWNNDAETLMFLRKHTNIPLPAYQCIFKDAGALYLFTEYVDGVRMDELSLTQQEIVMREVEEHVAILYSLRSKTPGGQSDGSTLCPPHRMFRNWRTHSTWKPKEKLNSSEEEEYVFCHNDLGQHNIIVDPVSLRIKAILDWEFAGYWPEWCERAFWKRSGPSSALEGEVDDVDRVRSWLVENCIEVRRSLATFHRH